MMEKKLGYFAAPLFSDAEKCYNELIVNKLEAELSNIEFFLPQRDGILLDSSNDKNEAKKRIFYLDELKIFHCDFMVAILDGAHIDEGVAIEIGIAYSLNKRIIALSTDPRRQTPDGFNPMVENCISKFCYSVSELSNFLSQL